MTYYIYILYSASSHKYYVGQTNDVSRRLFEHNNPVRSTYTSKHLPWELACSFPVGEERTNALKVEKYIKKQKSRNYIKQLISSEDHRKRLIPIALKSNNFLP
jgi:putative endonuclease